MIGLFQELGPCGIDKDGKVYSNPYSWSNASNMLFIDHPAQVGFSYSIPVPGYVDPSSGLIITLPNATCPEYAVSYGTCGTYSYPNETLTANSTQAAAPSFWKTLQGFMGAFPQYSRNDYNFASESYGGHYSPVLTEYIETQNAKIANGSLPGAHTIKLNTVLIGNGWYDPLIQYQAYYNFTVYPGNTYDYRPFNSSVESQMYNNLYGPGNCIDQIKDCYARGIDEICSAADNFCAKEVESLLDNIPNRDEYDIRELSPDPFPYNFYVKYLNTPAIQAAIGAVQNFSDYSNTVGTAFGTTGDDGRESNTIEDMRKLLEQGITVMMYTGDADYNCNWLGGEVVSNEVGQPGFATAGYVNISTSDSTVHGQVRQSGGFSFVRIYNAGHEVPFYQPLASLEIFERAIAGKDIATGTDMVGSAYRTVGTAKSMYREGNSTVQFKVVDPTATYNTSTNEPNPVMNQTKQASSHHRIGKRFKLGEVVVKNEMEVILA